MEAMTLSAWIFMILAWSLIIGMTGYCYWKLLTSERQLGGDDPEEPEATTEPPTEDAEPPDQSS